MIPKSICMENCLDGELYKEYDRGHVNIFRGKHKDCPVAIKIVRLYLTSDFDKRFSMSIPALCIAEDPIDTGVPGILPRSCCVEASPTPAHFTAVGCEYRMAPARHDI